MSRRLGILTFAVAPFGAITQEWRWAEELGFDHAWIPDTWSIEGFFDFEAWTLLSALAQATSRLRVGTLVTTIIARHPALIAAEALTVDQLSEGRVELGVGIGDRPADCDVFGVPRWPPAERVARLEELDRYCAELGRDPMSVRRCVLAYRQAVDPLSSLDAFDHFVGSYAELGIGEFVFYWPPIANLRGGREISPHQRAAVERIASERLAPPRTEEHKQ